jgi:hypothetical protein
MQPYYFFTSVFVCCFAASLSAEPQLAVQLDRTGLYEGEKFHYQLIVSDASPINDSVTPDISGWSDFDVQLLGKQTGRRGGTQSSFTIIIGGRTVRDDRATSAATYSTQYSYALTPKRTGSFSIPLPKITVNGKTLVPQTFSVDEGERRIAPDYSIAVSVLEPDNQDIVFMKIETNRKRLYPLQPLDVTLVVHVKSVPSRNTTNPLTMVRQPPQLQIPWATDDVPRGFQPTQKLENWLNNYPVRPQQGGFAINNYVGSLGFGFNDDFFAPFSPDGLFQRQVLQFSNTPRQIRRADAQGNETTYWEYRFTRTFMPQEFGNYSFGPVTLKGILPVDDPAVPNGIAGTRIYAIAPSVAVAVVDVPQESRPADYIGAFGTFRWEASLTPQKARVGDPLTLTLRLSGQGSTVNVRPLNLSEHPDVAAHFRVHMPPTEEVSERACTFTYTIRPQKSGAISFPSLSVSVFDVNTERFVTLHSLPIPLDVAESESIQSPMLFGSVAPAADTQLAEGGLFGNKTTLTQTLPPITFVQWAIAVALLGGGYVIIALGVLLLRYQRVSPQQQRQRWALSRAKSRLAEVALALRQKDSINLVGISGELQGAFFGYIADKTNGAEQGMTTNDVCRQLLENKTPESLVSAIRAVLESLDAVKYGGLDIRSLDELTKTAATLLQQVDAA